MSAQLVSVKLELPGGSARKFVHRGSEADRGVLKQIFKERDYALTHIWRGQEIREIGRAMKRPLIIDAGANMGASAVWFTIGFPHAHIVAVEPDPGNVALLTLNTEGLDVDVRSAAIGSRDGRVNLVDLGFGEWAYKTEQADDGAIPLLSMDQLVTEKIAAGYQPFIAKIDIEGGEAELFSAATEWIDHFPLLIVELHDWMTPGQATSRAFLQAVAARDRDFVQVGENTFSIRNTPVPAG